jgi:alpha-tubulin suppressor-like RCC1 family protein
VGDFKGTSTGIAAVVFNLTVTEAESNGFVTAYASGADTPSASNLNYARGQTVANLVTAPVGPDGQVTLFNRSAGRAHLIADVAGFYLEGEAALPGAFRSVAPTRFLDTRTKTAVGADSVLSFQAAGVHGVPSSAAAVVFNLTATEAQSAGFVTAYPGGTTRPASSNLNYSKDQTVPNLVTVPVGADGTVSLFNRSGGTVQLVADVAGYFLRGQPAAPGLFQALAPSRVLDTRRNSPAGADSPVSFQVAGVNGVPVGAASVVFNLTVTETDSFGFVSAYASGTDRSAASIVNYAKGQTVPNLVTVPIGADGRVTLFNRSAGKAHLIADVAGYHLPGTATDGAAYTWGSGYLGEAGTGYGGGSETPEQVLGIDATTVKAAYYSRYALLRNGTVKAWGGNAAGQLGNGTTSDAVNPVTVRGLADVAGIDAGYQTAYAVLKDGTVRAWGANSNGQLGNGSVADSPLPVQVKGLSGVKSVVAGDTSAYALLTDGTVYAWGDNASGQLGNGTTTGSPVPVKVQGLAGIAAVTPSGSTTYARTADGKVWSWGSNSGMALGTGDTSYSTVATVPAQIPRLTGATSVTAGLSSGYALLGNGTVMAWGYNGYGQLGTGNTVSSPVPVPVEGVSGAVSITAAFGVAYAVLGDGRVLGWGYNRRGELGNGTTTDTVVALPVQGLQGAQQLSVNSRNGYALASDGSVYAWGRNSDGQLGNGTTTDSTAALKVPGLTGVRSIVAGGS